MPDNNCYNEYRHNDDTRLIVSAQEALAGVEEVIVSGDEVIVSGDEVIVSGGRSIQPPTIAYIVLYFFCTFFHYYIISLLSTFIDSRISRND